MMRRKADLTAASACFCSPRSSAGLQVGRLAQAARRPSHGRLFPPEDLGLLEGPDRDDVAEARPDHGRAGIADGATVADIGAGAGWFTIRLARRVGPNGIVYAQDVQRQMLEAIRRRVAREGLRNVQTRLGAGSIPNLPARIARRRARRGRLSGGGANRVAFLRNLATALKPGGRIGIVNYKPGQGGPGPDIRIDSAAVEADARAAGLRVLARETLPYQYLLVLGR